MTKEMQHTHHMMRHRGLALKIYPKGYIPELPRLRNVISS